MRIRREQALEALRQFHKRNHPEDENHFTLPPHSETFGITEDGTGDIRGFAFADVIGHDVLYGVIHTFEIASDERDPVVARTLARDCVAWLKRQGCRYIYIPALRNRDFGWLARELAGKSGRATIVDPYRESRHDGCHWEWAIDPQTGYLYPEPGPEDRPTGIPPQPVRMAGQIMA